MHKINYDFSTLLSVLSKYTGDSELNGMSSNDLRVIKNELNKFFKDSECKEVLYTTNTDKMFFGAKVIAMIDPDNIYDYLIDDDKVRINKYIIELDSHLFDPVLGLTSREILAVILHEIGHMVNDAEPIQNARNALNAYLAANKDHIRISQSIHYKEILAYGLKDYLSKTNSMFYTNDISEIRADEFAEAYGLSDDLDSAYTKIVKGNMKLYSNCEISKFIVFGWTLSLYKDLKIRRIGAIKTLARAKHLTGSRLEKMEMENVIRRIKRIDDGIVFESTDTIRQKLREKMKKARLNNLKTIDNTFYELNMQVRNVEDENDALYLMRQINNSIAIIDEYRNSEDCDQYESDKCNAILDKFIQLREKLSSTIVYKNKNYGIFVNYPDIVENRC